MHNVVSKLRNDVKGELDFLKWKFMALTNIYTIKLLIYSNRELESA